MGEGTGQPSGDAMQTIGHMGLQAQGKLTAVDINLVVG